MARVAIITGANSGIGAATAEYFAGEKWRVAMIARNEQALEETAKHIKTRYPNAELLLFSADVSSPNGMQAAADNVIKSWQRIDFLFANAGINGVWAPIEEISLEEWNKTIGTNLTGTYLSAKAVVPHMKKQNSGSIVFCASINGTRTFLNPGTSAYCSSKAGQVALMKVLALELAKHNIRVNAICPGAIRSQINEKTLKRHIEEAEEQVEYPGKEWPVPLTHGKPGEPIECAKAVWFLASDQSAHISGTELFVDGAESLFGR